MAKEVADDDGKFSFGLDLHFGSADLARSSCAVQAIIKGRRPKTYKEILLECERAGISKARVCRMLRWLKKTNQILELHISNLSADGKRIHLSNPIIFYSIKNDDE